MALIPTTFLRYHGLRPNKQLILQQLWTEGGLIDPDWDTSDPLWPDFEGAEWREVPVV